MLELTKDLTEPFGLMESETSQRRSESESRDKETKMKMPKKSFSQWCNMLLLTTSKDFKLREQRIDELNKDILSNENKVNVVLRQASFR